MTILTRYAEGETRELTEFQIKYLIKQGACDSLYKGTKPCSEAKERGVKIIEKLGGKGISWNNLAVVKRGNGQIARATKIPILSLLMMEAIQFSLY